MTTQSAETSGSGFGRRRRDRVIPFVAAVALPLVLGGMGGVGHLLFFGQGGHLSHADSMDNIRLFGKEVAPRLLELGAPEEAVAAE